MILALTTWSLVAQEPDNANSEKKIRKVRQETIMMSTDPGMPMPPPPPPPGMDEENPAHPMIKGLSDDQKQLVKEYHLKQMQSLTPIKNKVMEKTARLNSVLSADSFDEKEARQLADELGDLKAAILKVNIETHRKIRGILTPDQQIIFDSKPKKFLRPDKKR